jgi:hypothetical protein
VPTETAKKAKRFARQTEKNNAQVLRMVFDTITPEPRGFVHGAVTGPLPNTSLPKLTDFDTVFNLVWGKQINSKKENA